MLSNRKAREAVEWRVVSAALLIAVVLVVAFGFNYPVLAYIARVLTHPGVLALIGAIGMALGALLARSVDRRGREVDERERRLTNQLHELRAWEAQLRAWQRDLGAQRADVAASEWHRGELQREIETAEQEVGQLRGERKRLDEARRDLRCAMRRTIVEIALADASKDEPALQVPSPEDETDPLLARAVKGVCANLPERHRRALYLRFGLGGDSHPCTYREVGEALGITRSEAARLVKRDLGILRHPARCRSLRG